MIECEECGRLFPPDQIESCPECGDELCEKCFQKHVKKCFNNNND